LVKQKAIADDRTSSRLFVCVFYFSDILLLQLRHLSILYILAEV